MFRSSLKKNIFVVRLIQIASALGGLLIVAAIYYILLHYPVPTTPFNRALLYYKQGYYQEAIGELADWKGINKNQDAQFILAWSYYNNKQFEKAEHIFVALHENDPNSNEAKEGLAFISLSLDNPQKALFWFSQMSNPAEGQSQLILAEAYYKLGRNIQAAEIYRSLIESGREVQEATKRYLSITGFSKYAQGQTLTLAALRRPKERWIKFRAPPRDYIEVKNAGRWEAVYIKGANLSGALPGCFVTETPQEVAPYLEWFDLMVKMNCNTFRIYNRHYPAFYRALKMFNESSPKKLWFIQEVWLDERDPDEGDKNFYDLYDPSWTESFYKELKNAVDVVHGNADIPYTKGRSAGIYSADVSEYVLAYGIGREIEPYIVSETNAAHPEITHYDGTYVTVPQGSPIESWFAEKFDYIAKYEIEIYNAEHPLTLVSWGPLDGLYHPDEPNYANAVKWAGTHGIQLPKLSKRQKAKGTFEANVATNDMTHYKVTPEFEGGIFVAFNIYPHWPHFMYEGYQGSYDTWGHNPFFGYLLDLKAHYKNMPLLIGEYGIPTSWVPIIEPLSSFNYGGYSEEAQGELIKRLSYNVQAARCAGGLIFEFQDGWWKREVALYPFVIFDRKPYWYNGVDPEEGYGLQGYHAPLPIPQLHGDKTDWTNAQLLSKRSFFHLFPEAGSLKRLYAYSDAGYLYLRLDLFPWNHPEALDWSKREYWIGISTLPGYFGTQLIGNKDFYVKDGANFLIKIKGGDQSEILIAENYNPTYWASLILGSQHEKIVNFKKQMLPSVELVAPFETIYFPGAMWHFSKTGTIVNPPPINRSRLHYGTAELNAHRYDSRAAWHMDDKNSMIEIRIPWGLLYMMDPSSRKAFGGITDSYTLISELKGEPVETEGIGLVALIIEEDSVIDSLPSNRNKIIDKGELPIYRWERWTQPKYETFLKASYFKAQETLHNLGILP